MALTGSILVTGATGRVGGIVFGMLEADGFSPIAMSHRPEAAKNELPRVREGDMRRPETLHQALDGIETAFLVTPLGPDESDAGLAFIDAAEKAGVQKIVYVAIMNIEAMAEIPHFATKVPIRRRLLEGARHVVLDANFFMQNDLLARPALQAGIYPLPIGTAGVHSVDARDVARAAVRAMTGTDWDGQAVPVCGPDLVTGPKAAETYARATGQAFRYGGDAIDPFIGAISAAMPMDAWVENDLRRMMEVTQKLGCPASADDIARCASLLGQAPRAYTAFVTEVAAEL
jgi:uncharacterized protein YbjT (DUF2867 family)